MIRVYGGVSAAEMLLGSWPNAGTIGDGAIGGGAIRAAAFLVPGSTFSREFRRAWELRARPDGPDAPGDRLIVWPREDGRPNIVAVANILESLARLGARAALVESDRRDSAAGILHLERFAFANSLSLVMGEDGSAFGPLFAGRAGDAPRTEAA